jgi:competence protein ComEC
MLTFVMQNLYNAWHSSKQQKLIVYNVPQHKAVDFINGNSYQFIGDSILLEDGLLQSFHLKPGRIDLQLDYRTDSLINLFKYGMFYQFNNKRIGMVSKPIISSGNEKKIQLDLLVISKNPRLSIADLRKIFNCKHYVFDASSPAWKIEIWIAECKAMKLNFYSIPAKGAFVYDVGI